MTLNLSLSPATLGGIFVLGLHAFIPGQFVTVKRAWDRPSNIRYNDV